MNLYPDEAVIREPENQREGQEGDGGEPQEGEEGEKPEDSMVWGDIFEDGYEDDFDEKLGQGQDGQEGEEPKEGQEPVEGQEPQPGQE